MRKAFSWWPAVAYAAVIAAFSLWPVPKGAPNVIGIDKLYHFVAYSVFGVLLCVPLSSRVNTAVKLVIASVAIAFAFGIVVEALQHLLTDYRTASVWDAAANGAGAITGSLIYSRLAGGR